MNLYGFSLVTRANRKSAVCGKLSRHITRATHYWKLLTLPPKFCCLSKSKASPLKAKNNLFLWNFADWDGSLEWWESCNLHRTNNLVISLLWILSFLHHWAFVLHCININPAGFSYAFDMVNDKILFHHKNTVQLVRLHWNDCHYWHLLLRERVLICCVPEGSIQPAFSTSIQRLGESVNQERLKCLCYVGVLHLYYIHHKRLST